LRPFSPTRDAVVYTPDFSGGIAYRSEEAAKSAFEGRSGPGSHDARQPPGLSGGRQTDLTADMPPFSGRESTLRGIARASG